MGQVVNAETLAKCAACEEGEWSSCHDELIELVKTEFGKLCFTQFLAEVLSEKAMRLADQHVLKFFTADGLVSQDRFLEAQAACVEAIEVLPGMDKADPNREVFFFRFYDFPYSFQTEIYIYIYTYTFAFVHIHRYIDI